MPKGEHRAEDLNTSVPQDWSLSGFSSPQPEGDTHYRLPLATQTALTFPTSEILYVQYRYQVHAPVTEVTGRVFLNGRLLDTYTFPKGRYTNRELGAFTHAGRNELTIEYQCGSTICKYGTVKQFWTRLTLTSPLRNEAQTDVGLGVEHWWLDAPQSLLTIQGTGPLVSDGTNYYRNVESNSFSLEWPKDIKPIDAFFEINAKEPFRVTTRVDDIVVSIKKGDQQTGVRPSVSLMAFPQASHINVQVDCLLGTKGCGYLYFTRITVMQKPTAMASSGWLLAGGILLLLISALWWGLNLPPFVRKRPA